MTQFYRLSFDCLESNSTVKNITSRLGLFNLLVQPGFLGNKLFFRLNVIRVRYTAIYRAHSGALGLFMETCTFGTLTRNDIIKLIRHRSLRRFAIDR
jgi:hypothetical protein